MTVTTRERVAMAVALVSAVAAVVSAWTAFKARDDAITVDLFRERLNACAELVGAMRSTAAGAVSGEATLSDFERARSRFEILAGGELREAWARGVLIHDLSPSSVAARGDAWLERTMTGMAGRLSQICGHHLGVEARS